MPRLRVSLCTPGPPSPLPFVMSHLVAVVTGSLLCSTSPSTPLR
jgi:hypothetical protein